MTGPRADPGLVGEGVFVAKAARSSPVTLAEKIDHLFRAMPAPKGEYSYEDVAAAIRRNGGPTISATYVWQLRKGMRDNPTKKHLEALGSFFGVPPSYFFDEADATRMDGELELLTAMRDPSVREVARRAAELSPAGREAVQAMIDQVRRLEGVPGRRRPRAPRAAAGAGGADEP